MEDFYRIKRLPPYVFTIVNDLKTETYFARLIISAENELFEKKIVELDARPSDCIALAIQQRVEIGRDTGDDELFEEALAEITERPLDLAFALRVAGLTRLDLHAVMAGEFEGLRTELEPPPL